MENSGWNKSARPEPGFSGTIEAGADTEAEWQENHESFVAIMEAERKAYRNANSDAPTGNVNANYQDLNGATRNSHSQDRGAHSRTHPSQIYASLFDVPQEGHQARGPAPRVDVVRRTLGQSTHRSSNSDNRPVASVQQHVTQRERPSSQSSYASGGSGSKRPNSRCPFGMTQRDIEYVVRAHNKQLESLNPLVDDFYQHEYNRRRSIPDPYLEDPGQYDERESWMELQRRPHTSAFHTAANMATVEKSLGTLQSWTPKAPKRIVEVAPMKSGTLLFTVTDDRVAVRAVLECGYDILSTIEDFTRHAPRPETYQVVQAEAEKLYNLFAISADQDQPERKRRQNEKMFAQMCSLTKGKNLIVRAMRIFQPAHQALVIAAVLRHLGFLCSREFFSNEEWTEAVPFWESIGRTLQKSSSLSNFVWILWSFLDAHSGNSDSFVTALGSEHGGSVIYCLLTRAYTLCALSNWTAEGVEQWNAVFNDFFKVAVDNLGATFQRSEDITTTWEITAMLDALTRDAERQVLHNVVAKLLRDGVPPPPTPNAGG